MTRARARPSFSRRSTAACQAPRASEISMGTGEFLDEAGRRLTLRGVNLGGSSKMPTVPDGSTHILKGFFETASTVSFVNRPFPLDEADAHLTRMRAWGFNVLRLCITWEAVEHAGPGQYDREFLRYLTEVVRKAEEYGMAVYVDPHQDVWSRFSGGDGAPAWTFEKVGLDVRRFAPTAAALVHQTYPEPAKFPRMTWPTNLHKLACATMFSVFWAGDRVAPQLRIDGEPAQGYLQRHYTAAMAKVAWALRAAPNVLGFGTMNEPLPGFVGLHHLGRLSGPLKNGLMPTPFEGMALASGHPMRVARHSITSLGSLAFGIPTGHELANPEGASAWLPGRECVWKAHGVWGEDKHGRPKLLKPDYFKKIDFGAECFRPFAERYGQALREAAPGRDWMLFVELPPADLKLGTFPKLDVAALGGHVVHAPHWYDQLTLFFGRYTPWIGLDVAHGGFALGKRGVAKLHAKQLSEARTMSRERVGNSPVLIGEVGVPFDLDGRATYGGGDDPLKGSTDRASQALSATVNALEANNLSYTLWCYVVDHTPEWGDRWNREDLSLYSRTAVPELSVTADPAGVHLGGRALRAFARPYCQALAGDVVVPPRFNDKKRVYTLTFRHDPDVKAPTLIFVPAAVQYPEGFAVTVSDGAYTLAQATAQEGGFAMVEYVHSKEHATHVVRIEPVEAPDPGDGADMPARSPLLSSV